MFVSGVQCFFVFFFLKQKTAYEMRISDWSSDVCSSDLQALLRPKSARGIGSAHSSNGPNNHGGSNANDKCIQSFHKAKDLPEGVVLHMFRSEERRVGKE